MNKLVLLPVSWRKIGLKRPHTKQMVFNAERQNDGYRQINTGSVDLQYSVNTTYQIENYLHQKSRKNLQKNLQADFLKLNRRFLNQSLTVVNFGIIHHSLFLSSPGVKALSSLRCRDSRRRRRKR